VSSRNILLTIYGFVVRGMLKANKVVSVSVGRNATMPVRRDR